jgi:hypothetical protein
MARVISEQIIAFNAFKARGKRISVVVLVLTSLSPVLLHHCRDCPITEAW